MIYVSPAMVAERLRRQERSVSKFTQASRSRYVLNLGSPPNLEQELTNYDVRFTLRVTTVTR